MNHMLYYDEPTMVTCPKCNGTGDLYFYAYSISQDDYYLVSEDVWEKLPATQAAARVLGVDLVQDECIICDMCCGNGEVDEKYADYDCRINDGDELYDASKIAEVFGYCL